MARTIEQYRKMGKRFGSGKVAREAREVSERWQEDRPVLARYGWGSARKAAFDRLRAEHDALRSSRAQGVAAKDQAVEKAQGAYDDLHTWTGQAEAMLEATALDHPEVQADLEAARGREADGVDAQAEAYGAALTKHRALLDPEIEPDALIAAGAAAVARLREHDPKPGSTRVEAEVDTAEVDVADGRLMEVISLVNSAARKAFRALKNAAKVKAYRYHHLRRRPSETADEEPAPSATPPATPAPVA
jgi:hypothetical protein